MFTDGKYVTAKEKDRIFKNFQQVIDNRDISLMKRGLYDQFYLRMGFIAHYSHSGFIQEYCGTRLLLLFEQILSEPYLGVNCDCRDLSFAIRAYAMEHFAEVVSELKNMKIQKEIDLMKKLAEKHGYAITITSPAAMDFTNYELKPDGSLSFKF